MFHYENDSLNICFTIKNNDFYIFYVFCIDWIMNFSLHEIY